jgi:amino acid transporter
MIKYPKYYKTVLPTVFGLILLLAAGRVYAQAANNAPGNGQNNPGNSQSNVQGADPNAAGNHLFNPINYTNLGDLIISVTRNFVLLIAVVSVAFIVLGGAELVISSGNPESIEKGKKTITWAVIGLIVALLAYSIVAIIQDLVGVK